MAQNDIQTMRQRLRDKLHDIDDKTWSAGEKDDLLYWAVRELNKTISLPLDPEAAAQSITLVSADYFYAIDSGTTSIWKVEYIDGSSNEGGALGPGSWEIVGDILTGNAKLHVAPEIVELGGTLRIHGYGRYTLPDQAASQATAIPDEYVQTVLALAVAKAYRSLAADRARFRQWARTDQVQNISINELIQMINDAEAFAADMLVRNRRWQKPVPGRV